MKLTKSMIINPSAESRELTLYAVNNGFVWSRINAVLKMLEKHYKKGVYDHQKAIQAFYPIACYAAKLYDSDFGNGFTKIFDVTAKYTSAAEMEKYFYDDIAC